MKRYVVGAVTEIEGRTSVFLSIRPGHYTDLSEALDAMREANQRHRRIWPDTNVSHHVYCLEQVPRYIEQADLSAVTERTPEEHAAFDAYLEASEALDQYEWRDREAP